MEDDKKKQKRRRNGLKWQQINDESDLRKQRSREKKKNKKKISGRRKLKSVDFVPFLEKKKSRRQKNTSSMKFMFICFISFFFEHMNSFVFGILSEFLIIKKKKKLINK